MALEDENYIALTTYRKSGEAVTTPVWVVPVSDGRIGFWTADGTGKTLRMRRRPQVAVQASDARGRPKAGSTPFEGSAEMIKDGPLFDEVRTRVRAKYGFQVPVTKFLGALMGQRKKGQQYADTVVLIRLVS